MQLARLSAIASLTPPISFQIEIDSDNEIQARRNTSPRLRHLDGEGMSSSVDCHQRRFRQVVTSGDPQSIGGSLRIPWHARRGPRESDEQCTTPPSIVYGSHKDLFYILEGWRTFLRRAISLERILCQALASTGLRTILVAWPIPFMSALTFSVKRSDTVLSSWWLIVSCSLLSWISSTCAVNQSRMRQRNRVCWLETLRVTLLGCNPSVRTPPGESKSRCGFSSNAGLGEEIFLSSPKWLFLTPSGEFYGFQRMSSCSRGDPGESQLKLGRDFQGLHPAIDGKSESFPRIYFLLFFSFSSPFCCYLKRIIYEGWRRRVVWWNGMKNGTIIPVFRTLHTLWWENHSDTIR